MTKMLTIRLPEDELAACDREAAAAGLSRTAFVRYALQQVATDPSSEARKKAPIPFKSWHLVGSLNVGRLRETKGETKGVAHEIILWKAGARRDRSR